ncbi:MAG: hypothetical protein OXG11_07200 [Chloroflexi bacterium]|nr:hypothetical protein [Chloroflexota bacterium]
MINKLRQVEMAIAEGSTVIDTGRNMAVIEQAFYRWRAEYGRQQIRRARTLKDLRTWKSSRRRRAPTWNSQILKEAAQGNFWGHPCSNTA